MSLISPRNVIADGRCRPWAWIGLALLLAGDIFAQVPESPRPSVAQLPLGNEPITPLPPPPFADPQRVALGERLFADTRLSRDGARACASCHDTHANGATGNQRDTALDGSRLPFNTPSIFNAALNFRLNWEGDFRDLDVHTEALLENPGIMGTTVDDVLARIRVVPDLARQFRDAYGREPDRAALLDAIATYERSLSTPESRFDRWLGGDPAALSADELAGYQLFKSFGCVSCHQGVNVGGNLFQRHGIFHPLAAPEPQILRVPTLRNVATTGPYFHDGSAPTLAEAVRQMGRAQLDRTLSEPEIGSIVAFLQTLTGTYRGNPVTAAPP
jgi:cytochrome c peroxidase